MSQYLWISAEDMHLTTGEDGEMTTGGKEEDLLPEEMYPPQDMEALPDVLTVEKKGTTCATAPKRSLYLPMKETTGKPTSLTYKMRRNGINAMTTKCMMFKKLIQ